MSGSDIYFGVESGEKQGGAVDSALSVLSLQVPESLQMEVLNMQLRTVNLNFRGKVGLEGMNLGWLSF